MRMMKRQNHRKTPRGVATPPPWLGRGLVILTLMAAGALGALPAAASEQEGRKAQDLIRSAMIYNFCKFVEWPDDDTPGDSIVLGLLGETMSIDDFTSIVGKSVGDIPLTVRRVNSPDELSSCQLLYIGEDQVGQYGDTLATARAESILTISQADNFCSDGGIIQLVERRGKLRFFINARAADEAQLSLSSQLLKVAKIVEGD